MKCPLRTMVDETGSVSSRTAQSMHEAISEAESQSETEKMRHETPSCLLESRASRAMAPLLLLLLMTSGSGSAESQDCPASILSIGSQPTI